MRHLFGILLTVFCAVSLVGGENLLVNPDFRALDGKGIPKGWMLVGKTKFAPAPGGVTLSLGANRGKQTQATAMQHLHKVLQNGKTYVLTARISSAVPASAQFYIEGSYRLGETRKGMGTDFRPFPVDAKGVEKRVVFIVPAVMDRIYLSMRTTSPEKPVTFGNIRLEEYRGGGANLLKNPELKEVDAKGNPAAWNTVGKTKFVSQADGFTLSLGEDRGKQTQATVMQHFSDRVIPGMTYRLTVRVSAPRSTSAQVYVEGSYVADGKDRSLLTRDFQPFKVDASGCLREVLFTVPAKMSRIYVALRTGGPEVPVTFSKVFLTEAVLSAEKSVEAVSAPSGANLIRNPRFTEVNAKGLPVGYDPVGKTVVSVKDGAMTLSLGEDRGKQTQATVMQHFADRVVPGKTYILTAKVRSEKSTRYQLYVEGFGMLEGKRKGLLTDFRSQPVDAQGCEKKIIFTVPCKMTRLYVSMRTTDPAAAVTFSDLKLTEYEVARVCGGYWDAPTYPETPAGGAFLPAGRSAVLRQLPVKAGKTYRLSYKVAARGDTGRKDYNFHKYTVSTRPLVIGGFAHPDVLTGAMPKDHIFTVPESASYGAIDVTFTSQTAGELQLSGFDFREFQRDPSEEWFFCLTEPVYRNTIYPRTDTGRIAGRVAAGAPASRAAVSIRGIADIEVELKDGKGEFSIPAEKVPEGKFPLVCRILDAQGKELKRFREDLRKVPAAGHEVIFDARQVMLVDGKPFFSISEYRAPHASAKGGFYHMARHGVNTYFIVNYPNDPKWMLQMLDKLHACGIKAVVEVWSAGSVSEESRSRFINRYNKVFIPEVRQHPALLAYFTNDEPFICGRNPEPIVWTRQFLMDADPYHPVWVNQSPSNAEAVNFRPFYHASDITGIDIYPVPVPHPHCDLPDKSLNCVGAYTRRMVEVGHGRKAIWMILQAFNWFDHNNPKLLTRQTYPTEDEMRFMYFDALFNGSRGVSFYGTTQIRVVQFRQLVYRIMEELRDLSGLFTGCDYLADLPQDNRLVRIARLGCGGKVYYGIFNQEPKEKRIAFPMDKPLVIYREGRQLIPHEGRITVKLRPYEVLICGSDPLPAPTNAFLPCDPGLEDTADPAFGYIRMRNGTGPDIFPIKRYQGKANWIWNKSQITTAGNSCVLMKKFRLDRLPARAELLFCADDEADAYLNGKVVGGGDEHGRLHRYDVTKLLKEGENLLLINARDGGGLPCAMMAEFRADGKVLFVSDDSWQARAFAAGEDLRAVDQRRPVTPAFIAAPAGKGPWGFPLMPED